MTQLEWLTLVHVLAAIVWVGGAALLVIMGPRFGMSEHREDRLVFARITGRVGPIFTIAALVLLVAGIWMVADTPGWEFDQLWVTLGFTGVAAGAVLGMGFYGPQNRKLLAALESGSAEADALSRRIGLVSSLELVLLVVVVWAMVAKPGL